MNFSPYHKLFKKDPYFQKAYHQCYLNEGEEVYDFEYQEENNFFWKRAIKRPIINVGQQEINKEYFDLETVYGFGGCVTNSHSEDFVRNALKAMEQDCREKGIVASFMRFHPLNDFPEKHGNLLDFCSENRKVIIVDTRGGDYPEIRANYASSLKRNINKAHRNGLTGVKIPKDKSTMEQFMDLYYATMERKGADDMYFFEKEYFHQLFSLDCLEVYATLYEQKIISMILLLKSDSGHNYYHLGATHSEFYSLNPNPFILDYIVKDIFEDQGAFLFLGGGNANTEDDPLFRFKKKFNKESVPFFIGGLEFDQKALEELKNIALDQKGELPAQFLSYRFI